MNCPAPENGFQAHQDQRTAMFQPMHAFGGIPNYEGIRISAKGRRFKIQDATIWRLTNASGHLVGEAATFEKVTHL